MAKPRARHAARVTRKPEPSSGRFATATRGTLVLLFSDSGDGVVQAVVEIHKSIRRPELPSEFLARDQVAGTLQKNSQHLDGLTLQAQLDATFSQLSRLEIQFERVETQDARC